MFHNNVQVVVATNFSVAKPGVEKGESCFEYSHGHTPAAVSHVEELWRSYSLSS